jgi:formylglycine-generating enzyme required for sulfatase activity
VVAAVPPSPAARLLAPSPPTPPAPPAQAPTVDAADDRRFRDCSTCPWMVRIPAGSFIMGQGAREPEALPAHRVDIRLFALAETPITVADWKRCLAAAGCASMPRIRVTEDRTPIHNVSWEDAVQYASWLSRTTNQPYRLPSEAEWEYAARAGSTTRYWWGDSIGVALANCADCGGQQNTAGPLPVDALKPNAFGLYGMLGGVDQWVADCWFPSYQGAPADGSVRDAKACMKRVLRGGSFRETQQRITLASRGNYDAGVRYIVNGFRVARSLE